MLTNTTTLALVAALAYPGAGGGGDGTTDHNGSNACLHCRLAALPRTDEEKKSPAFFDEATGRLLLNYPPHRLVDTKHMSLRITIPDMNTPRFTADCTLTFAPIARDAAFIDLNAAAITINSVSSPNRKATFKHDGQRLNIAFDPPVKLGEQGEVTISYTLADPTEGIVWTPESPAWPGRPAQLHSQGEPESNRFWFPCHDFPNERLTTEIYATVPKGFTVVSNGRLVKHDTAAPNADTFHWLQDKDHVNYLVSLIVGKFDVVDVGSRALPMPVYAPLGRGDDVKRTYGRTPKMVDTFARLTGRAYPWDKYAQSIVWNFGAGGMENTSATTMFDTAILDKTALMDGDLDGLIAHELAHQWFGDLLTCNSWEHIWLNEGFATYFANLWSEERDGKDAYLANISRELRGVTERNRGVVPLDPAMASKEYKHPWDVFRKAANPYPKGSLALHALRQKLGDECFFRGLALYVSRFQHKTVETNDLRRTLEEASGQSLERFFAQYVYRPGTPQVTITPTWDSEAKKLSIRAVQTQTIDGYNPAFALDIPVYIQVGSSPWQVLKVPTQNQMAEASIELAAEPASVVVDPYITCIARFDVQQSPERFKAQLAAGPTIHARMAAMDAIARGPAATTDMQFIDGQPSPIFNILQDNNAPYQLRQHAAHTLGTLKRGTLLTHALKSGLGDARVRKAAVEALAEAAKEDKSLSAADRAEIEAALKPLAESDPSYGVRAAALNAAGQMKPTPTWALAALTAATKVDSQNDQIRNAAIEGLADLGDPAAFDTVAELAKPGHYARTRPSAVYAMSVLAKSNPERAIAAVSPYLNDPEERTRRTAGQALVELGDPRAIPPLERFRDSRKPGYERVYAEQWIKQLQEKPATK